MHTKREMQNGCPNQASWQAGTINQRFKNKTKQKNKTKRTHGGKEEEKREKRSNKHFLKRKRRQEMSASNETKAGYTLSVYTIQSIQPTTTRQGNRRSRTTPHKERKNERIVKHRDYPPRSYIVNERYNSRNKRASQEKKQ